MPRLQALALAALVLLPAAPGLAKDPRRAPMRVTSLGDSITVATNAELFNPRKGVTRNRWASFVNGYVSRLTDALDLTDVNSHNQRITAQFGSKGRKNKTAAKAGANIGDLAKQARKAVKRRSDYVTVFMGHNDVCGDDFSDIPTDEEFELDLRAGFDVLRAGLPPGATVYTLGMVDIYRLWQIGEELEFLGLVECNEIWENLLPEVIPCATMLNPDLEEADRQFTRGRLIAFNGILADVSAEYEATDPLHYWHYSDAPFQLQFEADDISPFDCFHPSAEGQKKLAEATWAAGPFAQ